MSGGWITIWAPLPPSGYFGARARSLPYPLEDPRCRLYRLGRHALWHGLQSVELSDGDEVLVPAYHHGSDVGALVEAGLRCRFYEAGERLEPDPAELEGLLGERTRALYLIHHLGFAQDAPRWRRWCDERGLLLIEDVAMAWLAELDGRPLGSWGDIGFFSLWKTFGLPDGGALVCERPLAPLPRRRALDARELALSHAKWLAQRWGWIRHLRPGGGGEPGFDPERAFAVDFVPGDRERGPAASSLFLLKRLCRGDVAEQRRRNHGRLLELLGDRVPAPFDRVQPGSCPFATPILTEDKPGLLGHLATRGVAAEDLWTVPHPLLPVDDFPAAAARRASMVGLPVHQELTESDLEHIAAAAREYDEAPEAANGNGVRAGDQAADFELLDQDGSPVRLSDFRGHTVVLYFYPEADTPGCTKQACGIRDRHAELTRRDAVVLGVSPDKPAELRSFADKYGLPFTLLSDVGHDVARRYGVWVRRPGLLPRRENERTTFVIGPDGVVQDVLRAVDPVAHDTLVAERLPGAAGA